MKTFSLVIALVVFSTTSALAEEQHEDWFKYFEGTWTWKNAEGVGGEVTWKAVAANTANIGTGKSDDGTKSAWLSGWSAKEKRIITQWFNEKGAQGLVRYKIQDANTLTGPGITHGDDGTTKAVVTMEKNNEKQFTVYWRERTVDGEKAEDVVLVAKRK